MDTERTCDGRCCAVFPLSWDVEGSDGIANWLTAEQHTDEREFIADMLVPLTGFEARQRWADLGFGSLEESARTIAYGPQPLYTCRHWDTETHLCTVYEQRPAHLCADFPYEDACHHKGCTYRKGIDYLVRRAGEAWEALSEPPSES